MQVNSPPTFQHCLVELQQTLGAWGEGDYRTAEQLCRLSRSAWAAYLDGWLTQRRLCTPDVQQQFRETVERSAQAIRTFSASTGALAGLGDEERARLPKFVESIEFRARLIRILHAQGVDAVCAAIETRKAG